MQGIVLLDALDKEVGFLGSEFHLTQDSAGYLLQHMKLRGRGSLAYRHSVSLTLPGLPATQPTT